MNIREMTRQECTAMLKSSRLGRLACVRDDRPYVVPIHFAFGDNFIFSFSLLGKKVEWMRQNRHVCLQVDDVGSVHGWKSVVVDGLFEDLPKAPDPDWTVPANDQQALVSDREREFAWSLLQKHANWWEPGALKPGETAGSGGHLFYQIRIETISGRQAFR
ncbi:pyridoxamine 5'-phosphate oxidase family protein [Mesorhizobium sp. AR10]|uniref:pyridoxamine 5'-phosphate oxidase family protein n=1 Tax=Mesorhizobium sp. AR10 TaxID=2865839 RepID=UPI00215F5127|nr:pyridoxamine 5'-phosphate oxidase family protein [Mesorhizobium sp. AR10]UVK37802.1 pyridoxamine 5'-phosphate oxidase family protein [Mesorhizobium sp. AR10]